MLSRAPQWLVIVLMCSTAGVFAAEPAADTIDEIQITATRRAASIEDVSAALSIISAEEITENKLVTDALAMQPGVYLQQTTPGQGAAIIRGLKGSEILHLVDGFRLNNAIFRNAPTQYLALVSPGAVERIEVVRGAPTSLYGSDADDTNNITKFQNPRVDELIELYEKETNLDKRAEYIREMDGIIYAEYPYLLDWYAQFFRPLWWDKFGMPSGCSSHAMLDIHVRSRSGSDLVVPCLERVERLVNARERRHVHPDVRSREHRLEAVVT